jgi:hypothetical protein
VSGPVLVGEGIDLRIERVAPDRLEVTAIGTDHTVSYVPTDAEVGCD